MTPPFSNAKSSTILIVDDNPAALYVKKRILSRQGHRVLEAENGTDALAIVAAELPDLVLLDVNLPDINGFDVCHELKTKPDTQHIKVLQTSAARISAPDRVKSLNVGADAYLVEPAEEEELVGTVQALLKLAQQERDNQRLINRLTESEARYRSLVERMPAAMYTIDREGCITFYNDQAAELWGRRPQLGDGDLKFCGSHKLFFSDGTPLPHDKTPMADALRDGASIHGQEVIIERPDGSRRHVVVHIDPLRDAAGDIIGAVNLFTDMTEQKQAEEALEEQRRLYQSVTDNASVGLFIMDAQQQCIFMNPAAERLTGYTLGEIRGRPLHDVVHHTRPDGRPYPLSECPMDKAFPEQNRMQGEEVFVHKDGHFYPVAFTASPLLNETGTPEGTIVEVQDITEQKQSEQALRESEERYRATFANAAIGIAHVGLDGRWLRFNDAICDITGYSRDELHHMTLADVTHPEDLDWSQARRILAGEIQTYSMEKRYIRKNRSLLWVGLTVSLMWDGTGNPLYFIAAIENIDERKRTEVALRCAQERLQRWNMELERAVNLKTAELQQSRDRLRVMATELNLSEQRERKRIATELHDHLQQMLVLGKLMIGSSKRAAAAVPACEETLKKVDEILSDALTYTRTLVADLSPSVLRDHGLAAALQWLGTYMHKHQLLVTVIVPDHQELKLPDDQVFPLFQSVRELLINSSKHAGTKRATLRMELLDGQVQITVQDKGKGFDLAAAAAGSSNGGISSKFGLFSIQERMRALGGAFDVQSLPGEGTTATLTLPLATVQSPSVSHRL